MDINRAEISVEATDLLSEGATFLARAAVSQDHTEATSAAAAFERAIAALNDSTPPSSSNLAAAHFGLARAIQLGAAVEVEECFKQLEPQTAANGDSVTGPVLKCSLGPAPQNCKPPDFPMNVRTDIVLDSDLVGKLPYDPPGRRNCDGAVVSRGRDPDCEHLFYCGRRAEIEGSDGRCGPSNGPPCPACVEYHAEWCRFSIRLHEFVPYRRHGQDFVRIRFSEPRIGGLAGWTTFWWSRLGPFIKFEEPKVVANGIIDGTVPITYDNLVGPGGPAEVMTALQEAVKRVQVTTARRRPEDTPGDQYLFITTEEMADLQAQGMLGPIDDRSDDLDMPGLFATHSIASNQQLASFQKLHAVSVVENRAAREVMPSNVRGRNSMLAAARDALEVLAGDKPEPESAPESDGNESENSEGAGDSESDDFEGAGGDDTQVDVLWAPSDNENSNSDTSEDSGGSVGDNQSCCSDSSDLDSFADVVEQTAPDSPSSSAEPTEQKAFEPDVSATELIFSNNMTCARRPGNDGCFPLAATRLPNTATVYNLTVEVGGTTSRGNDLSFGLAESHPKTDGDGFGQHSSSIGLYQGCTRGSSAFFSGNGFTKALDTRIEPGDLISLCLTNNVATFYINGVEVGSAPAVNMRVAGCTLNTDGQVKIVPSLAAGAANPVITVDSAIAEPKGVVLEDLGIKHAAAEVQKTIHHLGESVKLKPTNVDYLIAYAKSLRDCGATAEAEEAYYTATCYLNEHHLPLNRKRRIDDGLAVCQEIASAKNKLRAYRLQRNQAYVSGATATLRALCPSLIDPDNDGVNFAERVEILPFKPQSDNPLGGVFEVQTETKLLSPHVCDGLPADASEILNSLVGKWSGESDVLDPPSDAMFQQRMQFNVEFDFETPGRGMMTVGVCTEGSSLGIFSLPIVATVGGGIPPFNFDLDLDLARLGPNDRGLDTVGAADFPMKSLIQRENETSVSWVLNLCATDSARPSTMDTYVGSAEAQDLRVAICIQKKSESQQVAVNPSPAENAAAVVDSESTWTPLIGQTAFIDDDGEQFKYRGTFVNGFPRFERVPERDDEDESDWEDDEEEILWIWKLEDGDWAVNSASEMYSLEGGGRLSCIDGVDDNPCIPPEGEDFVDEDECEWGLMVSEICEDFIDALKAVRDQASLVPVSDSATSTTAPLDPIDTFSQFDPLVAAMSADRVQATTASLSDSLVTEVSLLATADAADPFVDVMTQRCGQATRLLRLNQGHPVVVSGLTGRMCRNVNGVYIPADVGSEADSPLEYRKVGSSNVENWLYYSASKSCWVIGPRGGGQEVRSMDDDPVDGVLVSSKVLNQGCPESAEKWKITISLPVGDDDEPALLGTARVTTIEACNLSNPDICTPEGRSVNRPTFAEHALLFSVSTSLDLVSVCQTTHPELVTLVLHNVHALLDSILATGAICGDGGATLVLERLQQFLFTVMHQDCKDTTVLLAVRAVLKLSQVHCTLLQTLEMMRSLLGEHSLPEDARACIETDMSRILQQACDVTSCEREGQLPLQKVDRSLIDPTSRCCNLLVAMIGDETRNLNEAQAPNVDKVIGSLQRLSALLRLSIESAAFHGVGGFYSSTVVEVCKTYEICSRLSTDTSPSMGCILNDLRAILDASISLIDVASLGDIFTDPKIAYCGREVRLAALRSVTSANTAFQFAMQHDVNGKLAVHQLLDCAMSQKDAALAREAQRVTLLLQANLLNAKQCSGDLDVTTYSHALLSASLRRFEELGRSEEFGTLIESLESGIGVLLASWLVGTYQTHTLPLDLTGPLMEAINIIGKKFGFAEPTSRVSSYTTQSQIPFYERHVVESDHPYSNSQTTSTTLKFKRKAAVVVTWDRRCETERDYDVVTVSAPGFRRKFDGHGSGSRHRGWTSFTTPAISELTFDFNAHGDSEYWGWKCVCVSEGKTQESLTLVKDQPWLTDLSRMLLLHIQITSNDAAKALDSLLHQPDAETELVSEASTSRELLTTALTKSPLLDNGLYHADESGYGDGGVKLHSICVEIADCVSRGRDLLASCAEGGPDEGENEVIRAVFAATVWHSQELGDTVLAWSANPTADIPSEVIAMYDEIARATRSWLDQMDTSRDMSGRLSSSQDPSNKDAPLARARLLLDVASKCSRIGLPSDTLEATAKASPGPRRSSQQLWTKVRSIVRIVRISTGNQSAALTNDRIRKAVDNFCFPKGDFDSVDASTIRICMQDAEAGALKLLNVLDRVIPPLRSLPQQARLKTAAQFRASMAKAHFPHPLAKIRGAGFDVKARLAKKYHELLILLTDPGTLLFGSCTVWLPADAPHLCDFKLPRKTLDAAMGDSNTDNRTTPSPWKLLKLLALSWRRWSDIHFEVHRLEFGRQMFDAVLGKLRYFGGVVDGPVLSEFVASMREHGRALLSILAVLLPGYDEGPRNSQCATLYRDTIEVLLALLVHNLLPQLAESIFALFVRALVLAGPVVADEAIKRFFLYSDTDMSNDGCVAVAVICAFIDGGEGALKMIDAGVGKQLSRLPDSDTFSVQLRVLKSQLDAIGYQSVLVALDHVLKTVIAGDNTGILLTTAETLIIFPQCSTILESINIAVDKEGRCTWTGIPKTDHAELRIFREHITSEYQARGLVARDLFSLSAPAQAALRQFLKTDFADAVESTVVQFLSAFDVNLPRLGSHMDGEPIDVRVRRANIGLACLGGFVEVLRPGALATTADKAIVQILRVDKAVGEATVAALPLVGSYVVMKVDGLTPVVHTPPLQKLELLLPYLQWHLSHSSVIDVDVECEDAFVRLRSSQRDEDPNSGGGWNRSRQLALTLRSLHAMLVHNSRETAACVGSDPLLAEKLLRGALSLGSEHMPNVSFAEAIQQLEETASGLVELLVQSERGLGGASVQGDKASLDSETTHTAVDTQMVGKLRLASANLGVAFEDLLSVFVSNDHDFEETMKCIVARHESSGEPPRLPTRELSRRVVEGSRVVEQTDGTGGLPLLGWIMYDTLQNDQTAQSRAKLQLWGRCLHTFAERLYREESIDAAIECFQRAHVFYAGAYPGTLAPLEQSKTSEASNAVQAIAEQMAEFRRQLDFHWDPSLLFDQDAPLEANQQNEFEIASVSFTDTAGDEVKFVSDGSSLKHYIHEELQCEVTSLTFHADDCQLTDQNDVGGALQPADVDRVLHDARQLAEACSVDLIGFPDSTNSASTPESATEVLRASFSNRGDMTSDKLPPLLSACITGDVTSVRSLIEGGSSGRVTDRLGENALHVASRKGHVAIVNALYWTNLRACTQTLNCKGQTPFFVACESGHLPVIQHFLDAREVAKTAIEESQSHNRDEPLFSPFVVDEIEDPPPPFPGLVPFTVAVHGLTGDSVASINGQYTLVECNGEPVCSPRDDSVEASWNRHSVGVKDGKPVYRKIVVGEEADCTTEIRWNNDSWSIFEISGPPKESLPTEEASATWKGPKCPSRGHKMIQSTYSNGVYVEGWCCNMCSESRPPGTSRWVCLECSDDFCYSCHTPGLLLATIDSDALYPHIIPHSAQWSLVDSVRTISIPAQVTEAQIPVLPKFDRSMSAPEVVFDGDRIAKRPSSSGCYPLIALQIPPDDSFVFSVRIKTSTVKGNSFTFGVAQDHRKSFGDGFGKENGSIGLFQNPSSRDSVKFHDSVNGKVVELARRVDAGDVVTVRLSRGCLAFYINKVQVAEVQSPPKMNIAGCTLHTDGEVEIVDSPLPRTNVPMAFSSVVIPRPFAENAAAFASIDIVGPKGVSVQGHPAANGLYHRTAAWRHKRPVYLECNRTSSKRALVFSPPSSTEPELDKSNVIQVGMHLEAKDRLHPHMVCVASVKAIVSRSSNGLAETITVTFDGWSDMYDYTADVTDSDLHPIGWCESVDHGLEPPRNHRGPFSWSGYLASIGSESIPKWAFEKVATHPTGKWEVLDDTGNVLAYVRSNSYLPIGLPTEWHIPPSRFSEAESETVTVVRISETALRQGPKTNVQVFVHDLDVVDTGLFVNGRRVPCDIVQAPSFTPESTSLAATLSSVNSNSDDVTCAVLPNIDLNWQRIWHSGTDGKGVFDVSIEDIRVLAAGAVERGGTLHLRHYTCHTERCVSNGWASLQPGVTWPLEQLAHGLAFSVPPKSTETALTWIGPTAVVQFLNGEYQGSDQFALAEQALLSEGWLYQSPCTIFCDSVRLNGALSESWAGKSSYEVWVSASPPGLPSEADRSLAATAVANAEAICGHVRTLTRKSTSDTFGFETEFILGNSDTGEFIARGVTVTSVRPDSPADGVLCPGDIIVAVNRQLVTGCTTADFDILYSTVESECEIRFLRPRLTIVIVRESLQVKWGLGLGQLHDGLGFVITTVEPDSPGHGKIRELDMIMAVNGHSTLLMTHLELVEIIRNSTEVTLTIRRFEDGENSLGVVGCNDIAEPTEIVEPPFTPPPTAESISVFVKTAVDAALRVRGVASDKNVVIVLGQRECWDSVPYLADASRLVAASDGGHAPPVLLTASDVARDVSVDDSVRFRMPADPTTTQHLAFTCQPVDASDLTESIRDFLNISEPIVVFHSDGTIVDKLSGVDGVNLTVGLVRNSEVDILCLKRSLKQQEEMIDVDFPTIRDDSGLTPLAVACTNGHEHVVDWLLTNAVTALATAPSDMLVAFIAACSGGKISIVRQLYAMSIEMQFDVFSTADELPTHSNTAMAAACLHGNLEVLNCLIEWGALPTVDAVNCLHAAALSGVPETISITLRWSQHDVNAQTGDGLTALMSACRAGHFTCVQHLVEVHGANTTLKDGCGQTAASHALGSGHADIAEYLSKAGLAEWELERLNPDNIPMRIETVTDLGLWDAERTPLNEQSKSNLTTRVELWKALSILSDEEQMTVLNAVYRKLSKLYCMEAALAAVGSDSWSLDAKYGPTHVLNTVLMLIYGREKRIDKEATEAAAAGIVRSCATSKEYAIVCLEASLRALDGSLISPPETETERHRRAHKLSSQALETALESAKAAKDAIRVAKIEAELADLVAHAPTVGPRRTAKFAQLPSNFGAVANDGMDVRFSTQGTAIVDLDMTSGLHTLDIEVCHLGNVGVFGLVNKDYQHGYVIGQIPESWGYLSMGGFIDDSGTGTSEDGPHAVETGDTVRITYSAEKGIATWFKKQGREWVTTHVRRGLPSDLRFAVSCLTGGSAYKIKVHEEDFDGNPISDTMQRRIEASREVGYSLLSNYLSLCTQETSSSELLSKEAFRVDVVERVTCSALQLVGTPRRQALIVLSRLLSGIGGQDVSVTDQARVKSAVESLSRAYRLAFSLTPAQSHFFGSDSLHQLADVMLAFEQTQRQWSISKEETRFASKVMSVKYNDAIVSKGVRTSPEGDVFACTDPSREPIADMITCAFEEAFNDDTKEEDIGILHPPSAVRYRVSPSIATSALAEVATAYHPSCLLAAAAAKNVTALRNASGVKLSPGTGLVTTKNEKSEEFVIHVGPSSSNDKTVMLPHLDLTVSAVPRNEQDPSWNDRFVVDVSGRVLRVQRVDNSNIGWGQPLELIAKRSRKTVQAFEVFIHEGTTENLLLGFVAADCAASIQENAFVGVCAGPSGGVLLDATKPPEMKKKRGATPVTVVCFNPGSPSAGVKSTSIVDSVPLNTTVAVHTVEQELLLCATYDGTQVRTGPAHRDWGHLRFSQTANGHFQILSLRNRKVLRCNTDGSLCFSGNPLEPVKEEEWRVDMKGEVVFLVSVMNGKSLQKSKDGIFACDSTSRHDRDGLRVLPCKAKSMGSLACHPGDTLGCKLTFKDNSLDGLIQFTLNGEVQGEANVGPVSPQMQNELCPIVCVGGHLSFSFVAPDDVCMPKSTLLESDKALVELDVCAAIAKSICTGKPPPRVAFLCSPSDDDPARGETPKSTPLRHPAHQHDLNDHEGSYSYYCDVCGSSPGPECRRYRCSMHCDWDVCEQCMNPFLPKHQSEGAADTSWIESVAYARQLPFAFHHDAIGIPSPNWTFACDEALGKVLAELKEGDPLSSIVNALDRYPILMSERLGTILRRARLIQRYSALTMRVMPLVALQGESSPATGSIRALRSLVLPMHKEPFVQRVLDSVRRQGGGDSNIPCFKISRAKVLSGKQCALDGSDSIAFQIFNALKQKRAHNRDELYRGRALWWQVDFIGEGGQDVGGLFRESVVDIGNDLMSNRTPLFIKVPNATADAGTLQDAYTPNPSCTHFEVYEWVGRLCAAAILSDESLVLKFPPLVWKLLGGAPVCMDDLEELDHHFVQNSLKVVEEYSTGSATVPTTPEVLESFCLTYSITLSDAREVNLVSGGGLREVTFDDRFDYQRLACQARLRESAEQIAAMRRGLAAILPPALIRMWTAVELERAVCGSPDIPVEEIRRTARYDLDRTAPEVDFLFRALEEMSNDDRSLFLRFVTGRARLPVSIKICRLHGSPESFPAAHTCFNQIDIPQYSSKEQAAEKILFAIRNTKTMDSDFNPRGDSFDI